MHASVWEGVERPYPGLIDNNNLPRLDVANIVGLNNVQGAGFRSKHIGAVQHSQAQGPEAPRVSDTDQLVFEEKNERIGAAHLSEGIDEPVLDGLFLRAGQQMDNHLAVHGGLEDGAALLKGAVQLPGVDQVAVVRGDPPDRALGILYQEGLRIFKLGRTGRGIPDMSDRQMARKLLQYFRIKYFRRKPHAFMADNALAIGNNNAGALSPRCCSAYSPR